MVDILALMLLHDESLVEKAVAEALASGTPSKQHVVNCLSRLEEPSQPPALAPPAALELATEPKADTARYDQLRTQHHES